MYGGHWFDREISKEMYERALNSNGYLTKEDEEKVLSESERWGYGAYANKVRIENGKYLVSCYIYNYCD